MAKNKKSAVKKPKMDPKMKKQEMQEEAKGMGMYKKGGSVKRKSC